MVGGIAGLLRKAVVPAVACVAACGGGTTESGGRGQPAPVRGTADPAPPPAGGGGSEATVPIRKDGTVYAESVLMGTRVSFNVWLPPKRSAAEAGRAIEAAFAEIERIDGVLSEWKPQTELSRLNRAARERRLDRYFVSDDLWAVLVEADRVSRISGGAFDVTFHGVGRLWSFEPGSRPPTPDAVARALASVGYSHVVLDPASKTVSTRRPGIQIGLGAIAKGYAVDRASKVLTDRGFRHHIVEAGGDTYVSGRKGGRSWVVGVQDPDGPGPVGVLEVEDRAVVTSGDYQRYFEFEGRRYAHILDPRTGYPVPEDRAPRSVTVVGPSAMTADAFATAVAVLGTERGLELVEAQPDLEAVVIDRKDRVHVTTGLAGTFRLVPPRAGAGARGGASAAQRETGSKEGPKGPNAGGRSEG